MQENWSRVKRAADAHILEEIAELINEKKLALRKASDEAMDDLMVQIIRSLHTSGIRLKFVFYGRKWK